MSRLLVMMFFGGLGGFVGWLLIEPWYSDEQPLRQTDQALEALLGIIVGGCIGAGIGFASGQLMGTSRHILRSTTIGLLMGIPGGLFGLVLANYLFGFLLTTIPLKILAMLIARVVGWSLFGALIGLAQGLIGRSARRLRQGLLGGAIGGGLAGAFFDAVGVLAIPLVIATGAYSDPGAPPRAIGFTITGAGIGLFIGLIELVSRQAWVRVLYGRREGKDYPIDRSGAVIGRDELADVPLRGDFTVAPRHAEIQIENRQYFLVPYAETLVNGQLAAGRVPLNDGDLIQIGGFQLQFMLKEGQAQQRARDQVRSPLAPPPPVPAGVCPYCGQRQDPVTGACACSVSAPAPQPYASPSATLRQPPLATAPAIGTATALVGIDGVVMGVRVAVPPNGLTVGRSADNALIVADGSVSRHHARLALENGTLIVYDLGSTNGTFVNEQRITQQVLRAGDVVRFGNVRFRVE